MKIEDVKYLNHGTLFKMKNSEDTFLAAREYYGRYECLFVNLSTGLAFTRGGLISFGYFFYHKEDDDDFNGVEVIGHVLERRI